LRSPRSFLIWLVIVAVAAAAASYSGKLKWRPDRTPAALGAPVTGRAKIIDGDSLEVSGERIRLFGIDAPESRQACRDARRQSYACGREAARALSAFIAGRAVTCTPVDYDRYGRDVAICTAEGRDLGDAMVRAGHAVEYARHSDGRYIAAEREARAGKRGIWAGEFEEPELWRRRNPR
jgi:endonuclease YncB( thermonuclease family)